jgi:hypothetical protein
MEYDITHTIANFVREADSNFEQQQEEHSQALSRNSCINPFYGRWVEMGVEFLFSVFELEDRDFAARLPALARLTKSGRRRFLKRVEDHLHACHHCALKKEHELNLNARIERAFQENSRALLEQLEARIPTC